MDGGGELRAVNGGAGFENERENKRVERESEGGLHALEESKGSIMQALVDVRGQLFRER